MNDRPLRLAVIGCGAVFERFHYPALQRSPDWQFVAACDPSPQRRAWVAQRARQIRITESLGELLDDARLDAALIASPPETHCALATQALQAGLHVLVEKPMAVTLSEAQQMVETARRAGRHLWIGFTRRFRSPYLRLREHLERISAEVVRGVEFRLSFDPRAWSSVTAYLGREERGAGVFDDVACHQLDLVPWLFGERAVAVKVTDLECKVSIARCQYQIRLNGGITVYCVASHADRYEEELAIQLKDRFLFAYPYGVMERCGGRPGWLKVYARLKTSSHLAIHKLSRTPSVSLAGFIGQLQAFASILRGAPPPHDLPDAASGLRCQEALSACHESLKRGQVWVSVR